MQPHERYWMKPDGIMSEAATKVFKIPRQGCTAILWAATSLTHKIWGSNIARIVMLQNYCLRMILAILVCGRMRLMRKVHSGYEHVRGNAELDFRMIMGQHSCAAH